MSALARLSGSSPVILVSLEVEIKSILSQSQYRQKVAKTLILTNKIAGLIRA
jgi:hypothetical protein